MGLFLEKNGLRLAAGSVDATLTMLKVATGDLGIDALTLWLDANIGAPQPG
jgi:prophage maintenance system killer protein